MFFHTLYKTTKMNNTAAILTPIVLIASLGLLGAYYYQTQPTQKKEYRFPSMIDADLQDAKNNLRTIVPEVRREEIIEKIQQAPKYTLKGGKLKMKGKKRKTIRKTRSKK